MQNKVLNEVAIEQMDDLIKAVKGGSSVFDKDGTLPELQDGEVTDPLMAVGNDGKAKKLPVKTLFGKHNIRGRGNIDLYKHHIAVAIDAIQYPVYAEFYSSNNLKCDSLTDLKTLLGNTFTIELFGSASTGASGPFVGSHLTQSNAVGILVGPSVSLVTYDYTKITLSDTVMAI